MSKKVELLTVTKNRRINDEYVIIHAASQDKLPSIYPGQFVDIKVENGPNTFLRRPISIHEVNESKNEIILLIQEVGEGSRLIAKLSEGDSIDMIYPLGNSFTIPAKGSKALLVGGGVGVAPMLILGRILKDNGVEPFFLLGARNNKILMELDNYEKIAEVAVTTEDGSQGIKGFVTDHPLMNEDLNQMNIVYTCGPDPMMRAVAAKAKNKDIKCEVSLENLMACGIGACLCCVVDTKEGHKCTCTEGPVFDIKDLKEW
ncbi:dihydroorotate dehydrogenase electron transfer subunit [Plebeiibacterium marinum]|uniref:Dihydroorotate dehydrogenase B (NAD(+)), electron transfer subunit n=1 Tax=Plebeiibacterium marinum TaxID=2992111 RepID=A0AAE3MDA4_9BACT|nr:dihydroorotate dehydrogenase electron transfer subunit [Plebeiobacterium marinum]MCW3805766.1 dihydroorotate dehydrogenase electron transfer subunit [Plebeiobacterium marinum]